MTIFEGADGPDRFFNDLIETLKHKGGEICGSIVSQDMLMRSLGAHVKSNAGRLLELGERAQIKCLISEPDDMPLLLSNYQFRTVSKCYMSGVPYFVYGDKQALIVPEGRNDFRYIVLRSATVAQRYKAQFLELWDVATPFMSFQETKRAYGSGSKTSKKLPEKRAAILGKLSMTTPELAEAQNICCLVF